MPLPNTSIVTYLGYLFLFKVNGVIHGLVFDSVLSNYGLRNPSFKRWMAAKDVNFLANKKHGVISELILQNSVRRSDS